MTKETILTKRSEKIDSMKFIQDGNSVIWKRELYSFTYFFGDPAPLDMNYTLYCQENSTRDKGLL
jgi:hypothetical protein